MISPSVASIQVQPNALLPITLDYALVNTLHSFTKELLLLTNKH